MTIDMASHDLCMTCCSTIAESSSAAHQGRPLVHGCCGRRVCATCLAGNLRLATFCPFCEDATAAFKKGRRADVTRAGDTLFDLEKALESGDEPGAPAQEEEGGTAPPAYGEVAGSFVIDDENDLTPREPAGVASSVPAPALLTPKGSLSEPEILKPSQGVSADVRLPERVKVSDVDSSSGPTAPQSDQHDVRQYWLRRSDTLAGIALRFGVSVSRPGFCLTSVTCLLTRSFAGQHTVHIEPAPTLDTLYNAAHPAHSPLDPSPCVKHLCIRLVRSEPASRAVRSAEGDAGEQDRDCPTRSRDALPSDDHAQQELSSRG